jgi:hypothetical protein
MLWRPLNYQRERQKQRDQQSSTLVFARDKEHTLCLRLIWLRPVLSPIRIHNSLIIPTLPTSLELFTSTHQLWCVPLCVCVCVWVCVVCVLWDLWIGCCVYTILVCALFGFENWVLRVHNSSLRSCGCCVCEWSGQCLPPAVMSVRRQGRGRSGDACMRHVGNARNAGWKKPSAILRNSNSSPLRNCVVLDCSAATGRWSTCCNLFHLSRLDEAATPARGHLA